MSLCHSEEGVFIIEKKSTRDIASPCATLPCKSLTGPSPASVLGSYSTSNSLGARRYDFVVCYREVCQLRQALFLLKGSSRLDNTPSSRIMSASLLLPCDKPDCSEPAYVFGFADNEEKTKLCQRHMFLLTELELPVFDILSFHSIHKPGDATVCDWTKVQGRHQFNKISSLETTPTCGLEELESRLHAKKASVLSAVERSFNENEEIARLRYEATKDELNRRRCDFINLMQQACAEESDEEGTKESLADYYFAGFSLAIVPKELEESSEVLTYSMRPEMQAKSTATSDNGCARYRLDQASYPLTLNPAVFTPRPASIPHPAFKPPSPPEEPSVPEPTATFLHDSGLGGDVGIETLVGQLSQENPELRAQANLVISQFSKNSEAYTLLKKMRKNPSTLLALKLSNTLAEAYYQAGWWSEASDVCERTLKTWGREAFGFEVLRALYYLTCSLNYLEEISPSEALARQWTAKLPAVSPASKSVLLIIQAEQYRSQGRVDLATAYYENGLAQAVKMYPMSYITASASRHLGLLYEGQQWLSEAEKYQLQAKQIFAQGFPRCLDFANCLHDLARLYLRLGRGSEAVESCLQACQLYLVNFPKALEFANCLKDLGVAYESLGNQEQAEARYIQASVIFAENFPLCFHFATCLHCLGNLCKATKRLELAEEHYMKASKIYEAQFYQRPSICWHQHLE